MTTPVLGPGFTTGMKSPLLVSDQNAVATHIALVPLLHSGCILPQVNIQNAGSSTEKDH